MSTAIQTLQADVYGLRDQFGSMLADPSIKFEAEAGFALQALMANEYSMKIALGNRQSVVNAVTNIAAIGISLNPARKQAYLVPRDGRICLDISYMGLMDLAIASGSIRFAQAALVYSGDRFVINGFDKPPTHDYAPFSTDRGTLAGVYVVVKTGDGDFLTHCMSIDAVHEIRDRSSAWKAWIEKHKRCPWVTDPGEMTKKTCVKQASKYWPKTDRLDKAIHHLNVDAGEGLAEIAAPAAAPVDLRVAWVAEVDHAATVEALRAVSRAGARAFKQARDRDGYGAFAAAVQQRGAALTALTALTAPPAAERVEDPFVRDMETAERSIQHA